MPPDKKKRKQNWVYPDLDIANLRDFRYHIDLDINTGNTVINPVEREAIFTAIRKILEKHSIKVIACDLIG